MSIFGSSSLINKNLKHFEIELLKIKRIMLQQTKLEDRTRKINKQKANFV